jgi:nucleoredoxin
MKFGGGKSVAAGQKVQVLEFDGNQLGVDAGNDMLFRITPNDCDLLDAANAIWSKLTPAQRAIDKQTLLNDASLWPQKVKLTQDQRMESGKVVPAGTELELVTVAADGPVVWIPDPRMRLSMDMASTDLIARAREVALVDPDKRPSRIVAALKGAIVDSDGKPAAMDSLEQTKVFALYYGASWCGPCRQFSPSLVKYITGVVPQNPHLTVVLMSNDKDDAEMLKYMKEEKMPWPALKLTDLNNSPLLLSYTGTGIPQLVITDRNGKVLANSQQNGQNTGPESALRVLQKLVNSGAAK